MTRVLLALALAGTMPACAGAAASSDSVVKVRIEHSRFFPQTIHVERGSRVTFEIVNDDPIDHEFIVGDDVVQLIHEKGTEAHHDAKDGEISVPAGETRFTSFTFTEREPLIYGCHLPGHYGYGMKGSLTIES